MRAPKNVIKEDHKSPQASLLVNKKKLINMVRSSILAVCLASVVLLSSVQAAPVGESQDTPQGSILGQAGSATLHTVGSIVFHPNDSHR